MINLYLHKTQHGKRIREISDDELKEGLRNGEIKTVRQGLYEQVSGMEYQRRDMVAAQPSEPTQTVRKKKRGRPKKEESETPSEDESE